MRTAVIIVTYNRKDELTKTLNAVFLQNCKIEKLYVIDNHSSDGTKERLTNLGILQKDWIEYIYLTENIGGAGGFYEGLKTAYSNGFDYYIMMDDDGRPINEGTFSRLVNVAQQLEEQNEHKIMINSAVTFDENHEYLSFGLNGLKTCSELRAVGINGIYPNHINPFNGTLISKGLIDEIGFPNKDFFIRGDEVDYQERARKANAYLATVIDSLYYHPTFELYPVNWKNQTIYVGICDEWKSYYQIRNYVYRYKRDAGIIAAIKEYYFQTYCAKKCNPNYVNCKPFMRKGFLDGLRGRLGKVIEPGQKRL